MEIWKPVKGYEGFYEVSDQGRIKRLDNTIDSSIRNGGKRFKCGHIMKLRKMKNGYLEVCLCKDGESKYYLVHRIVAEAFCEKTREDRNQVNHINLNRTDNRPSNLEWVTASENILHASKHTDFNRDKRKRIICVETGMKFESSTKASEWVNEVKKGYSGNILAMARGIRGCCTGKLRSAFGFHWKDI